MKLILENGDTVELTKRNGGRYQATTDIDGQTVNIYVDLLKRGPVAVSPAKARFARAAAEAGQQFASGFRAAL